MNMQKLNKLNIQDILGLTPMQEGMLFHYLSNSESKQYLEQLCLTLCGEIDEAIIKKAWNNVVQNNEMLRTIFKWDKLDKPLQIILKQYEIPYVQYDLSDINSSDKEAKIIDIKDSELNVKIDISENPLRIAIIKLDISKYELIITYHHILYDGWSNGVVVKEFVQDCNSLCEDKPLSIIKKNSFKEFIKYYQKQDKAMQETFWREHFNAYESKSTIWTKPSYSEIYTVNNKVNYKLNNKISEDIYEFCKKQKTTVAALIYTAWGILLQKYNNTNDIVFGTTVSGRNADISGVEDMVGLFINTLPLRVNSTEGESVQNLLEKVDCILKERDEYQSTSLVDIKPYSGIDNKEELFDTLVVIENYPIDKELLNNDNPIKIEEYSMTEMTNYKLTLAIIDFEGLELELSYDTSIFNYAEINRMLRHFENIIINIIVNQVSSISQIDMLTKEERQQILTDFNNTKADYPKDKTIHKLFEEQVEKTPDSIAIVFEDKILTYRELNERTNQLARILRDKGVVPDSIVGIMVERSIEMIVGIIGILKAGGAYLPIDTEYPQDRIEYIAEDSKCSLILTQKKLIGKVPSNIQALILEDESLYVGECSNPNSSAGPNNLAYIIYTSGSTGTPKGVMLEHFGVVNTLHVLKDKYPIKDNDAYLLKTSYTFDVSVSELFGWFMGGGRLVILKHGGEKEPIEILRAVTKYQVTHLNFVPSMLRIFVQILEDSSEKPDTLKYVFSAGEALTIELAERFRYILPNISLENLYGPTETTIYATKYSLSELDDNMRIAIGKPIYNTTAYIVDSNVRLQPIGVAGELCLSGAGLARGYLNRPKLTAEKFADNPFELGTKMYKTGDLARWLPDGNIEFLGRIDHQVKIRGYRIELGEIENKLLSHEAVKDTVVIAKDDNNGNKYLCAYIVMDYKLTIAELREHLLRDLPDYMIPSYFIQLEKLPLTSNGKVDRKTLSELDYNISTGVEYEAPRNSTEEKLVEIWREILGVDKIGINDNFFELGGHSLKATSLAARIHKVLDIEIPLREIFKAPTIKGISEYIKGSKESIYSSIEPIEEKDYYEMSSAQKRMYTLQQLDINSTSYNMPGVIELDGDLDIEYLKEVFDKLVQRHEVLRTSFEVIEDGLVQKVHKKVEFYIEEYNVEEEKGIEEVVKGFIRAFNLLKAPLLRLGLVKTHPNKHILMFDIHHIISDGVSMGILVEEFSKIYAGERLTPLRIQYKDFSEWQNELFRSKSIKAQEEYWLKQFEGEIPVLNLTTDYQRPAVQSFEGDTIQLEINKELTNKLRQISKATGSTMYMVLLSTFNILLSKYSGQEDIIVGSPIAGRPHEDLGNIIGMFVNTLAMRNYPNGEKTFKEFLKEVKENALGAYENQDYQFEELVEKLNVARDFSRNPLFDVMFTLQNMDMGEIAVAGLKIKPHNLENRISKFDMTVEAVELLDSISINLQYCTKLFSRTTIKRMYRHLENIIQAVTEDIDTKLSEVYMLTEEERQQILIDFNNTKADYPKDKTIHQLFEEQVERTPNNIAVIYEDKSLTYRELNDRANQVAIILRNKGVGTDNIVAIMVERSLQMIVGIIGILKAGGAYLPIDPAYPNDRIQYMLKDSGTGILLTQSWLDKGIAGVSEIIELDNEAIYQGQTNNLGEMNKSIDLAYVIYTSGSTGAPKGVAVPHRALNNFLNTLYDKFNGQVGAGDSCLSLTNISFDVSVGEIFLPLRYGGSLALYHNDEIIDIYRLSKFIIKNNITFGYIPPTILKDVYELLKSSGEKISLNKILVGVEPIKDYVLYSYFSLNPSMQIVNGYGPTEATICATMNKLEETEITGRNVPIGKPMLNTQVYIVDKNNMLQPMGIAGELCITGDGLTRGYLNRQELTAEKFVENPFEPGTKMYKTGDLARWLPDGNIEFCGRIDNQVKIRGYRIELGEIESKLLSHEDVKEAVVITRDDNNGNKLLCAYVIGEKELTVTQLRKHLFQNLPNYMIPSYFIQLDKLPLTPNGKVDRKKLPEPDASIFTGAEYEAPRNNIEEKLVEIWSEILGAEKIGINDNFFELGGHSLKATSLIAKMHKVLNVQVPLKEIFANPTIKGISEHIRGSKENIYSSIEPIEEKEYYEMSSAQKRMYTLQQLELDSTSYNMSGVLELKGELNVQRLKEAFNILIQRHEALRTSFELIDEGLVQKVHNKIEFDIEEYETEEDKGIEGLEKGFIRAFDLSKAPLLRVGLIKVQSNEYILMYDMHHIISDGVSMGILVEEFSRAYAGEELTSLRIQYKDFSEWQNELFKSDKIKAQEEYWLKQFEGEIPVLNLTTDYQRPAVQSFEGDTIQFEINKELTNKLRQISKATGSTMYMVLLSIFNILLSKYSGQEDIIVGSPIAGRPHEDLGNIIGMFVNTLAMRNYPNGEKTFKEFLKEVKENALGAYENQDYQFEELVEKLNVARDFSRNPLFDVMFTLQNMDMGEIAVAGLKIKPHNLENRISKFDMTLEAVELVDSISINLQYCTKLFNRMTIKRMYTHLENIIQAVTENIDTRLSEVDMLTEEERQQILINFNNTKADYPKNKTIHQLFEEQVEKTPDNIAVVYEEKSFTYRELNERANQLARVLRDKGIKSDSIVAIMVERSLDMIVGIMGVLKSGGAYLPIDPEYPKDRIEYTLEDSEAIMLLTQRSIITDISYSGEIIILNEYETCHEDKSNLEAIVKPDNLAYIIYTSGTTGKPKGAMIEHRNVVRLFFNDRALFDFTDKDVWTMFHSYCFDFSVWEMYGALLYGGKLIVIPKLIARDTAEYLKVLENEKVTVLNQTPSAFYRLIEEDEKAGKCELGIRYVIFGGEALMPGMLKRFYEKYPKTKLINMYGITETTVHVTYKEITEEDIRLNISNIGKPIPTLTAYIMDKNAKLLPIGVPGELCVGGAGVCRGYLRRPELTAEKFITNMFAQNPLETGEKLYRSGDLVRMLPDGNMEYMGRIDQQVKIRGHRIELGEIESKLLKYEGIKETIVIARKDEEQNNYLCAYIVLDKEQIQHKDLTVTELRHHLDKELPDYMIPSYFIQLEKLPLTANGKVDRKALPEPDGNIFTGAEYEAPRNSTEEKLVEIWREILGVDKISINDNFFELGGHSLKATSLVAKIHRELNVKIPLREIFNAPTVSQMSKYIMSSEENIYSPIKPLDKKEYYELSYSQKRLWILHQLQPNSIAYNIPSYFILREKLNEEAFNKAFIKLIERHESLRTSFEVIDGEPVQLIYGKIDFNITKLDISNMEGENLLQKRQEIIDTELNKPLNIKIAPLYRVILVKCKNEEYEIMICMHHIITDGWSMNVLKSEFFTLYNSYKNGLVIELKPLAVQYKDFASWQNSLLKDGIKMQKAKEFWIKNMSGDTPILNLPISKIVSSDLIGSSGYRCIVSSTVKNKLKQLAREQNLSLYSILLGILNIYLSDLTGQEDIIIGSAGSGRQHDDVKGIIGFFVNTMFIRNKIDNEDTFINIINKVNENIINVLEYQSYPIELLLDELKMSYPKISIFFNMLNIEEYESEIIENLESYHLKQLQEVKYDLVFYVREYANAIEILVNYKSNLFKPYIVENIANQYIQLIQYVVENFNDTIKDNKNKKVKRKLTFK